MSWWTVVDAFVAGLIMGASLHKAYQIKATLDKKKRELNYEKTFPDWLRKEIKEMNDE